ncbi:type II secretion system F family protein [Alloalcanivorax xenomutans]|uniref:type II secretion system F family protein n=1 Tax=Alloalcanivorax xenomutans TaxID=1094342 RepID=UPI003BA8960E
MASLLMAIMLACVAAWLAIFQSRRWEKRRNVLERLYQQRGDDERGSLALSGLSHRLTRIAFIRQDFNEVHEALKITGRGADSIQNTYLLVCWLVPIVTTVIGGFIWSFFGALALGATGFIGARRYVRAVARRSCYQQNLESIELAQVLRMLLEAGLSIERAFRIAAIQARPLIPSLVYRLDRFNRLMDSGADRGDALDDIGEGKEIPVLHNLTRLLKQAGVLGSGITESIAQVVAEAQEVEKSNVKEQVNKLGAKMTVIMMVLMLPALFIIIGGPAGINIVQALTR